MSIVDDRWENGIDHRPESIGLIAAIDKIDVDCEADLKYGGDGDIGETIAYLIDELIEKHGWVIMKPMFADVEPPDPSIPLQPIGTPEQHAKFDAIMKAGGLYEYEQEQEIQRLKERIRELEDENSRLRG